MLNKAYLIIDDLKLVIMDYLMEINKHIDNNNSYPSKKGQHRGFHLTVEAPQNNLLWEEAIKNYSMTPLMQIRFEPAILGSEKTRIISMYDCHVVYCRTSFNSTDNQPITDTVHITCGGVEDSYYPSTVYEEHWRVTRSMSQESVINDDNTPEITSIQWVNTDTEEQNIKSISYKENASLIAKIENPEGSTATITIEKEDGTEFSNGEKVLNFNESINEEGIIELTQIEIKEQWEEFKTSDMDKLVAKVSHSSATKKSSSLQLKPNPQVIVNFRPHNKWKGEFGFDWLRTGDTSLFGDNDYETIVSKQYSDAAFTKLEKDGNKSDGHLKKAPKLFEKLKNTYNHFIFPWSSPNTSTTSNYDDYYMPWLSLLKDKEAKFELIVDIKQEADFIEFEANKNFQFTPSKIDIKGLKGIQKKDSKGKVFEITIKCLKEFENDEEIIINSYHLDVMGQPKKLVLAGKIKAWANDAKKQKEKEVVFVQIKTPAIFNKKENTANALSEKTRIGNYLNQAFIKLHPNSKIITLDLTNDKGFNKFISGTSIDYKNSLDKEFLDDFIKKKLKKDFKGVYNNYFEAFYFAEKGGAAGNTSGYSLPNADFVVVFSSANDQTASHEFLHAFNLAHSFSNVEADKNAEYTYQYKQTDNLLDYSHHVSGHKNSRTSLWYWQWVKANNSIK